MNDKSSTSLAIISVLTILIVLFIAISNVEDAPVRRPFPTMGAESAIEDKAVAQIVPAFKSANQDTDSFETNFPEFVDSITPEVSESAASGSLNLGINSQLLTKSGLSNFIIKPRPFDGILFDEFEVSMLSYLDILDKRIVQIKDGNEREVLRVYQFNFEDTDGVQEIYNFLKADLKDELGVTLNETNQFGMGSFFINLEPSKDIAFLVVKTKTNVYALSYPKANEDGNDYFSLVSKLLAELI